MANEYVRNEFLSRVRLVLDRAKDASGLGHSGLSGRAREVFVKDLLSPILPPYVQLGSGKIGDADNRMSGEVDVVIYSAATLPPLMLENGFGVYPADACIYAIEVKSTITAEEWKHTITNHRKLLDFRYLPAALTDTLEPAAPAGPPIIRALFAFDSDLSTQGKDELARYRELDPEADRNPAVPVFCVAGRRYYWFKPNEPAEKWIRNRASDDHEEIVDFIGGVGNTIPNQIGRRGRPRFGEYIIRPREFDKM